MADDSVTKPAVPKPLEGGEPISRPKKQGQLFAFRGHLPRRTGLAIAIGTILALLGFWELVGALGGADPTHLPRPSVIAIALWRMITQFHLLYDAWVSTLRIWAAFIPAVIMAVPIGILMSGFRPIGAALEPIVDFIRYLPVPALVPLSIIWFGTGEDTKIFLLWLGTFFQLVLLVADDMRRVPQEYVEIAYTAGARPAQMLSDVALRAMLPTLFDNIRITIGWCWTYLIVAEIVVSDSGLGFVIWTARRYMKTPEVMAGIFLIGLIGLATDQAMRYASRRLFRYL